MGNLIKIVTITLAVGVLAGCGRGQAVDASGEAHGRYAGVGLYSPTRAWSRLAANQAPKTPTTATPLDDQVIIVVEDSRTGELRACGDLTGYCIGMNPWKTALAGAQLAPLNMTQHATKHEVVFVPVENAAENTAE